MSSLSISPEQWVERRMKHKHGNEQKKLRKMVKFLRFHHQWAVFELEDKKEGWVLLPMYIKAMLYERGHMENLRVSLPEETRLKLFNIETDLHQLALQLEEQGIRLCVTNMIGETFPIISRQFRDGALLQGYRIENE